MLRRISVFLLLTCPLFADKRPLTHADYDGWRHIQNQQLSPDGRYLAYAVFPQRGDGEVIIRTLASGKEVHQPAGELPPPPAPNYANPQVEETPPPPPGISIKFTPDSATAVFLTFAPHDEIEKAKRAKKKADEMPKGDLVMVNLASGTPFRAPRAISFQVPTKTAAAVAYLQQTEAASAAKTDAPAAAETSNAATPASTPGGTARKIQKGDLVLRSLKDGKEQRVPDVSEYTLLKDSSLLVYVTGDAKTEASGVFVTHPETNGEPVRLLGGKGKYQKLTWSEEETRLAFLSDRDDVGSRQPQSKLYLWDKQAASAAEVVDSKTAGFPAHWVISERAPLTLSKSGQFIFFGTSPAPAAPRAPDKTPADEKVSVDLWAWNDDYIQPMQKVRAATERARSYRAVYDAGSSKFIQLADVSMNDLTPSEDGRYAIGNDDRAYRRMQEYDERFEDSYLVDTTTGARKPITQKHLGRTSWSPDSRHAVYFDGKDWMLITAPEGTTKNITAGLPVPFGREVYDMPSKPPSEGPALWTKDGNTVLLNDRFDVWRYEIGSPAPVDLTAGEGRKSHITFRVVRSERDDPADRYLDGTKPILLRAENEDTRNTGFFRTSLNATTAPVMLLMAAKNYAPPIKARNADVYVTAEATFSEFPDLRVTDAAFHDLKKVSAVGVQMENIAWGTSELMHFESTDGTKLEGTLYKPANFDAKKKYPMIVYIYERLSQGVNNFVEPRPTNVISPSYYTSNGYIVLEPDIAYRTGYPGQSALRCVLPAVQAIVDRGYVNEKAIGIQGHSWGGYQIAYMVTQTNRFRAAAPGAPVANMISAYDGIRWGPGIPRQFQYERTQSRIGGTPWEYPLRYIENSPIFMVDRIKTPLLMIHNDADDAVPWYQGIEYYLALRRLEKEVYLFSYNGEPHNLRRRPNQKDYTLRLQQFFDYYLKGAEKPAWMEHGIPFIEKSEAVVSTDSDGDDR